MSRVRTVLICLPIACVASLALARIHPFGDAGLYTAKPVNTSILNNSQIPSEVRTILVEKCADCHSTQTRFPSMAGLRLHRG